MTSCMGRHMRNHEGWFRTVKDGTSDRALQEGVVFCFESVSVVAGRGCFHRVVTGDLVAPVQPRRGQEAQNSLPTNPHGDPNQVNKRPILFLCQEP